MTKPNVHPDDPTPAPDDLEAPAPADQPSEDPGIPHSDGSTFSDGSGYA